METPVNCGGNPGQLRRFEYEPTFVLPLPLQGGEGQVVGLPSGRPPPAPAQLKYQRAHKWRTKCALE